MLQCRLADRVIVLLGQLSEGGVDQQLDLPRDQQIDGVGTTLVHLEYSLGRNAARPEVPGGAFGSQHPETERVKPPRNRNQIGLVVVVHGDEHRAFERQGSISRDLRLCEGHSERVGDSHDLAGRAHFRPKDEIDTLQLAEGKHRLLDRDIGLEHVVMQAEILESLADHYRGRQAGQRYSGSLGDERHRPGRAGIDLEHVDHPVLDGVLHVE